jgi:hypothetical protein
MVARATRSMGLSARLAAARAARTGGRLTAMLATGVKGKSWWTRLAVMVAVDWSGLAMVGIWYPPGGYINVSAENKQVIAGLGEKITRKRVKASG